METSVPLTDQLREIQRQFLTGRLGGQDLPPETLVLDKDQITSQPTLLRNHTTKSTQQYTISRNILKQTHPHQVAPLVSLSRSSSAADEPPVPLYDLVHAPSATDQEYSLAAAGEAALGNIVLALPPDFTPALQETPIYAILNPSKLAGEGHPLAASPDFLFTLTMSWNETIEYHIHDTNGETLFLASEEIVDGKKCLLVAAATNQRVRDALVGMWCLRLWREARQEAERARRAGRNKMRRVARSRKGMRKEGRRPWRGAPALRLNRFERLRFGKGDYPELYGGLLRRRGSRAVGGRPRHYILGGLKGSKERPGELGQFSVDF